MMSCSVIDAAAGTSDGKVSRVASGRGVGCTSRNSFSAFSLKAIIAEGWRETAMSNGRANDARNRPLTSAARREANSAAVGRSG